MRLFTSSSDNDIYIRTLPKQLDWRRVISCTLALTVLSLAGTEYYARSQGHSPSFPQIPDLWVAQWYQLEQSPADQLVFIGASRTQFDLIMDNWEIETGLRPVMLAWPGSPADGVLRLLAEQESYRGTVICGIAPSFTFGSPKLAVHQYIQNNLALKDILRWSLSYHISQSVRILLRNQFLFTNESAFSPIANLRQFMSLNNREGLLPPLLAPFWARQNERLQSFYTEHGETNLDIIEQVQDVWNGIMTMQVFHGPADIDQLIKEYTEHIKKIKSRGGNVVFIRHPSSDDFLEFEKKHYPRKDFFDRLCEETDSFGIHFEDYPELAHYDCPEWSHLKRDDAIDYTRKIIRILDKHSLGTL